MSFNHPWWLSIGSTDRPMIFTLRLSNSGLIFAMYPSSVVHTGVKSFGCENSTAHESPIQSWKRMRPSVVSASKSGAVSPIFRAIYSSSLPSASRAFGTLLPTNAVVAVNLSYLKRLCLVAPAATAKGEAGYHLPLPALLAQLVEHLHGKEGVDGSSPSEGS